MSERFMVAEEGWYKAYVVDTKLDSTVAGPFRYAEEAVYEARMMERMEEEIEENCECGLTENGSWDESLFDEWGCDCERKDAEEEEGE